MGDTVMLTAAKQCIVQHPISHVDSSARAAAAKLLLPTEDASADVFGLELAGDWLRLGVAEGERLSLCRRAHENNNRGRAGKEETQ
jgi:hypothetical protein